MNKNSRRKLKALRKSNPDFFKSKPRKSIYPKVAAKRGKVSKEEI